ncbi:MAG: adenosine deaminase [Lachnospiraceae bacterium]
MIDLHVHLDGSLEPEEIIELSKLADVKLPTYDVENLRKLVTVQEDCTSLVEYLEKFELPLKVLQSSITIEQSVFLMVAKLAKQGLCYAEIRFAPQLHLRKGLTQIQVVEAALSGLGKGIHCFKIPCQLILCCMRGEHNDCENMETIEVAKEFISKGICAVDLAGNERDFPTDNFADVFEKAKKVGIPITIHAGEAAGAESVKSALVLGASRIGHGIHSIENQELLNELKAKKIILETCFSSNLQTKSVKNMKEYPIKKLIDQGILVAVNTDNMTVSGTTIKKEYQLLEKYFSFSVDELKQLALNAVKGAFLSENKKDILCNRINKEFGVWISTKKS